jgi:SAM-dependent methyltransferase
MDNERSTAQSRPDMKHPIWSDYYKDRIRKQKLYPSEWIVRTLSGSNYPALRLKPLETKRSRILDLGCGDGRNLTYLQDLGFDVHATEISEDIVEKLSSIKNEMGWDVTFRCGSSMTLPYKKDFFDVIVSSWSFYYLSPECSIDTVISEIARTIKPQGLFIGVIPDSQNSVLQNAELLGDGTMIIRHDPMHLRNGTRWLVGHSEEHVRRILTPWFHRIVSGHLSDNYYGFHVSGHIFVAEKR